MEPQQENLSLMPKGKISHVNATQPPAGLAACSIRLGTTCGMAAGSFLA